MSRRFFEGDNVASGYFKSRPHPPAALVHRVIQYLKEQYEGQLNTALDVGCGSGQNTGLIAEYFKNVVGIDVSPAQIEAAVKENTLINVQFIVGQSENLSVPDKSVELITSSTAAHWFDLPRFFAEGQRVLCKNGVMALYCNKLFTVNFLADPSKNQELNTHLANLCRGEPLGKYWPAEIDMWENEYRNIEMPYRDFVRESDFCQVQTVPFQALIDRIKTWPAYQSFVEAKGEDQAKTLLADFIRKFLSIVNMNLDISLDSVEINMENPYFLLMARV